MRKFHCRVYGFVCLKGTDEGENPLYRKYLSLFKNKSQKVNVVKMENDIQIILLWSYLEGLFNCKLTFIGMK